MLFINILALYIFIILLKKCHNLRVFSCIIEIKFVILLKIIVFVQ